MNVLLEMPCYNSCLFHFVSKFPHITWTKLNSFALASVIFYNYGILITYGAD